MALLGWTCSAANLTIKVEPSEIRASMSSFEEDHLDLVLREGTNVSDRVYLYSATYFPEDKRRTVIVD